MDNKKTWAIKELSYLLLTLKGTDRLSFESRASLRGVVDVLGDEEDKKIFDICAGYDGAVFYDAMVELAEGIAKSYQH